MDDVMKNFARNLKVAMQIRGTNATKLAEKMDFDQSTIRRLLLGQRGCSLGLAVTLCKELEVNLDDMCFKKMTIVPACLKAE